MQEHALGPLEGWGEPLDGDWRPLIREAFAITAGTIQLKEGQPFPPKAVCLLKVIVQRHAYGSNMAFVMSQQSLFKVGTTGHSLFCPSSGPLKLHVGIVRLGNASTPGRLHYQSI